MKVGTAEGCKQLKALPSQRGRAMLRVSINITISRTHSFTISYFGSKFTNAYN